MNSTEIGDELENRIFRILKGLLDSGNFMFNSSYCRLYQKKGYFSKDREKEIIFDIALEVYLPGEDNFSILWLFECKNYRHPVPVDDVEEFHSKLQQVSASKGVIAAASSFQSGTRNFAKSKRIGLMRYFDPESFKWVLLRSPSGSARTLGTSICEEADRGLSDPDYTSSVFDLYLESSQGVTNSLWDFCEGLLSETADWAVQFQDVLNPPSRNACQVEYLEKEDIEEITGRVLAGTCYLKGSVSLEEIVKHESSRSSLNVHYLKPNEDSTAPLGALGRISFETSEIELFNVGEGPLGRERFTLAHELAHYLLNHGRYMAGEYCQEIDFAMPKRSILSKLDIGRMEWQANYFASCLLMPRIAIQRAFRKALFDARICNKGYGELYIDAQPCNLSNYAFVTSQLEREFEVSRSALYHRLIGLDLIVDNRAHSVGSLL
jgi:hypothetical protein